ncbi:MAG: NOP5/NOP56 family protein [Methanosarcinaceae archaeon]|nr:NOP5/NOP56 family protein [Methanosarcinaceae archaeon]
MKIITWFGILTLDDSGKVVEWDMLSKDTGALAERLVQPKETNMAIPPAGFDLRTAAIECGFVGSTGEYNTLLRDVSIRAAKKQISGGTPDMGIIQAVEALDDIDDAANSLSERLAEWYGMYFPEVGLSSEPLARFVAKYGSRSNVSPDDRLYEKATSSMGAELTGLDEELVRGFAENICTLYDSRSRIEEYLIKSMETTAPNLVNIAGALIGARLVSMAGGLEKLARFPSSTIQVIGANRALFKHLRARAPSPKHGIIFNHPQIKNSPWWQRGKIARALAAKISLAVRMDVYSGNGLNESLKTELDAKIESIKAAHPKPPKRESKGGSVKGKGRSQNKQQNNKSGGRR